MSCPFPFQISHSRHCRPDLPEIAEELLMSTSPSEAKCGVSAVSDPDACDITVNLTAVSCVGRYPGCKAL